MTHTIDRPVNRCRFRHLVIGQMTNNREMEGKKSAELPVIIVLTIQRGIDITNSRKQSRHASQLVKRNKNKNKNKSATQPVPRATLALGVRRPSKLKPRLTGPTASSGMMRMFPG